MLKRKFFCCIFLLFIVSAHSQKVGLVLSGGGAKGAVHIGIIKALEDNNIPIDYIAGTSIGAIVGSLYAMGYTPDEMLELFLSDDFYHWQTGKIEDNYQYYSRKNANQPDFIRFTIPLDTTDIKSALIPNSLVNPIQMNQAFLQLFSQANAQSKENFNDLFVPFLCVASDVYHKKAVISRNGDLGDAVRSSMTFPLVFSPIVKDGIPLFDGGIYDNFPVQPMKKAFKPDIIIGSSVAGGKKKQPQEMDMYDLMENMVMQQTVYNIDPEDGIMMKFLLENVGLLDFNKSKTLFDMGYQYAEGMIDSIKSRIERRVPLEEVSARRDAYKKNLPPLVFNHIYITGVNDTQKSFIESQIRRNDQHQFTIEDFKKMYFKLLTNSKIKEILPHAVWDPEKNSFDLYLDIQVKNEIIMSFGGNISSISANQLYLGLGYQSLTEISTGIRLDMQVGNTYTGAALLGKVEIPSAISFDISGMLVHNYRKFYESEKLFIDTDIMTFIHQRESFGKISAGFPFHNNSKLDFLLGYATLEDKYYQNTANSSYNKENLDQSAYNLFSAGVLYKKYSQDAKQYPTRGQAHRINLRYLSGNEKFLPYVKDKITPVNYHSWLQLDASLYNLHTMSNKFNFGYNLQGIVSTKELLNNYTASVLQAPAYTPTPHSKLIINEAFRANQFIAGGIVPIFKINSSLYFRGDFHGFLPVYPIQRDRDNHVFYGDLFTKPAHLEEVSLIFQLSFISVGLYANHYSYPDKNWNFGLNIGYLIFNPKYIP